MPTVTFTGHAGLALDGDSTALLLDPWLGPDGAFLGSWHQYPRNDHLDVPALLDVDWVAISHEHLDHFDPWVTTRLQSRTRVLIPQYPSTAFRDRLSTVCAREIIEIPAWERFPIDNRGSWITAIPELSPMCHDAAFLVVIDGHAVLHCNDARLTAAQARRAKHEAGGTLDVMALQASGASWHPICYEYPPEEFAEVAMSKRVSKLRAVQRLVRQTEPTLAVPFAGPPCFLDEDLFALNEALRQEGGAFCDAKAATEWLREHLPGQRWDYFKPGDAIELGDGRITRDPVSAGFDYSDEGLSAYLTAYAADRAGAATKARADHPDPGADLFERFSRHFAHLAGLSDYFLSRIDMLVRFDIQGAHGGVWDVRLTPGDVTVREADPQARPHYRITTEARWLDAVLTGRIAWEDLLISFRLSLYRDPDVYNDYLVGLLKHANTPALQAVEEYETRRDESERIVVNSKGRDYDIPRYCPHAGEDLSIGAVVDDGRLHCLAHNFTFDLATGECINARSTNLTSRPLYG